MPKDGFVKPGEEKPGARAPEKPAAASDAPAENAYYKKVLAGRPLLTASDAFLTIINSHVILSLHTPDGTLLGAAYIEPRILKSIREDIKWAESLLDGKAKQVPPVAQSEETT